MIAYSYAGKSNVASLEKKDIFNSMHNTLNLLTLFVFFSFNM